MFQERKCEKLSTGLQIELFSRTSHTVHVRVEADTCLRRLRGGKQLNIICFPGALSSNDRFAWRHWRMGRVEQKHKRVTTNTIKLACNYSSLVIIRIYHAVLNLGLIFIYFLLIETTNYNWTIEAILKSRKGWTKKLFSLT